MRRRCSRSSWRAARPAPTAAPHRRRRLRRLRLRRGHGAVVRQRRGARVVHDHRAARRRRDQHARRRCADDVATVAAVTSDALAPTRPWAIGRRCRMRQSGVRQQRRRWAARRLPRAHERRRRHDRAELGRCAATGRGDRVRELRHRAVQARCLLRDGRDRHSHRPAARDLPRGAERLRCEPRSLLGRGHRAMGGQDARPVARPISSASCPRSSPIPRARSTGRPTA